MRIELYDINYLNVVELNISGDKQDFIPGAADSKFLDTVVFNLFVGCFERSHKLYDYNEPTRFTARQSVALLNALKEEKDRLEWIPDQGSFASWIRGRFLGKAFLEEMQVQDPCWKDCWEKYRNDLTGVLRSMIELVDRCISEEKILWVKGY